MLEAKNSGRAQTNPNYQTLLAFKPRQVLLAERTTKVTTMKQCSSKTLTLNPDQKAILLQSVLGYLDRNGFSKALKRLLAEAQIEVLLPVTFGPYTYLCIQHTDTFAAAQVECFGSVLVMYIWDESAQLLCRQ